jgi:hypothetical protein
MKENVEGKRGKKGGQELVVAAPIHNATRLKKDRK